MSPETTFGIAFVVTLAPSLGAVGIFWRYLVPVLADYCGDAKRGRLWSLLCCSILLFLPLFALSLNLPSGTMQSWLVPLVAILRWPLLALFIAILMVAGIALALHVPRDLPVTRAELDDLKRLLEKVQEMRAREIVSRADAMKPVNPKELDELNRLVDKIQTVRTHELHGRHGDVHSAN